MFRRLDPLPLAASALALLMLVAYRAVMSGQGSAPLLWVQAILLGAGVLAAGSAPHDRPRRSTLLVVAGVGLCALGLLAILSLGLPILLAGALCLAAAARSSGAGRPA